MKVKIKIYKTIIIFISTGRITILPLREESRFKYFKEMMRRTFGAKINSPKVEYRKLLKEELHSLHSSPRTV
jgi:hypothetical protein